MTMTNNWTIWRRNGIAVDTLDFFENLLSKSTKLGQCIQTSEVSWNLTSNFSEVSLLCFQLILKKGHRRKQKKVKTKVSRHDTVLLWDQTGGGFMAFTINFA